MIDTILNNKEWLFSGVGVVILLWIFGVFKYLFNLLRFGVSQPKLLSHKIRKLKFWDVSWDFTGYFLGMSSVNTNITISSFQVHGTNNTNKPFPIVSGYLQSNITNEKIPILLESMPPEETNGIPPKCKFFISALFRVPTAERQGMSAEEFISKFSDFTFVFKYGDRVYTYRFNRNEVERMINLFKKGITPKPIPKVTKKNQ